MSEAKRSVSGAAHRAVGALPVPRKVAAKAASSARLAVGMLGPRNLAVGAGAAVVAAGAVWGAAKRTGVASRRSKRRRGS